MQHNDIDILLISESHFTDRSYFKIPSYTTYFTNHPDNTAHAGTAIIIKNTIKHVELPKYVQHSLQATIIKVYMRTYDLAVAAVYCPPRYNLKKENFKDFFETLGNKFIAGGDYNSKHILYGSRLTTTKGKELMSLIQENNYHALSTGTPTYWPTDPNKIPDLLDLFITNGISPAYMDITPSHDLSSDHSPIIATISCFVVYKKVTPKLHNNKTNWEKYRTELEEEINLHVSLKSTDNINETLTMLNNKLKTAAQNATPVTKAGNETHNIPVEIKKLIAQKRKARKRWHQTHAPADKTTLNRLSNQLKTKLKEAQESSFTHYITNLNRYDNSIWKPIKNSKKPKTHVPPIRDERGMNLQWARDDDEKTQLFAEHLAQVFTPNDDQPDNELERDINNIPMHIPPIRPLTVNEVQREIKYLNTRKAPGIDKLTPTMIKELPRKGIVYITLIFNAIIRLNYWPKLLKTAEIILIPKQGKNPNEVSSYRPISLLPVVSKILERLLLQRIESDPETEEWIPLHQFGFRKEHSTVQQVHRVVHCINLAMELKQYCTSAFLDVSQAFDKVWHTGLIYKIKKYIPISYYKLLRSYLSDREFRTRVNESTSNNYPIKSGVPQGSVLGPLLYVLFTADLPTSNDTITGTFADDTVILATHENPVTASIILQRQLNDIQTWVNKWKIKMNESKSVQVTFTLRRDQCPPVSLNNTQIPQTSSTKYLGIHLDSRLTWNEHIRKKRKQIDLRIKDLYWLIGKKSKLALENKLLIYKTIIKPIWMYGIQLWGCASKSNINIIQRSQSKILRIITNAPWYVTNQTLHEDLKIPYIRDEIAKQSTKHCSRLELHVNPILHPLLEPQLNRRLKRNWTTDLKDG